MNDGITNGNGKRIRHTRRPGTFVRVTSHAAVVPTTVALAVTVAASAMLRASGPRVESPRNEKGLVPVRFSIRR
jgi:hypothetical protein